MSKITFIAPLEGIFFFISILSEGALNHLRGMRVSNSNYILHGWHFLHYLNKVPGRVLNGVEYWAQCRA